MDIVLNQEKETLPEEELTKKLRRSKRLREGGKSPRCDHGNDKRNFQQQRLRKRYNSVMEEEDLGQEEEEDKVVRPEPKHRQINRLRLKTQENVSILH